MTKFRDKMYANYISPRVSQEKKGLAKLEVLSRDSKFPVRREIKLIEYDPFFGARLI